MQSLTPEPSSSWRRRARAFLTRLLRSFTQQDSRRFVAWADMQPIDLDEEDSSLTERDIRLMK
jgi:hypothetical protein